jgi:hypothetical protein
MRKSQIGFFVLLTAVVFPIAGCSHVGEDWKAAQAADTTEAYQDFLRQHPDRSTAWPPRRTCRQLAEDRDWQQASKADTLDAYQQFVAVHADGKWAQEARVRIENFQLGAGGQTARRCRARGVRPAPGRCSTPAAAASASKPKSRHQPKAATQSRLQQQLEIQHQALCAAGHTAQRPARSPPGISSAPAFRHN